MDNIVKNNKNDNVKWIVVLCVTAVIAIVGWTTTANIAMRLRAFEEIKHTSTQVAAVQQANTIRISVLENKYDTIQADLAEIKVLLQKMRDRE